MKIGYSISIGEHVDAVDVEYADISDFKIVCPICREPVHKVERGEQHFLSHKQKTPGEQDCELRVASFTREQLDALDAISRGQTLDAFFADLPDMIDAVMPRDRGGLPAWREVEERMRWRPDARRMRLGHKRFMADRLPELSLSAVIDDILAQDGLSYTVHSRRSKLNRHLQRRAALDMYRTIMTPAGKIGFNWIYWAGWSAAWIQYVMLPDFDAWYRATAVKPGAMMHGDGVRARVVGYLSHCMEPRPDFDRLTKRAARQLLWEVPGKEAMSLERQISNDVAGGMLRILSNLDYVGSTRRRHARAAALPG